MLVAANRPDVETSFSIAEAPVADAAAAPIVVIGAGPAGMKLVRDLRRQAPGRAILIFGEERWAPYNRVLLTPLFAGETPVSDIYLAWSQGDQAPRVRLIHRRIVSIDCAARTVTDAAGTTHGYAKLVIATGSRPHIPAPLAIAHRHIFTFRDIDDAEGCSPIGRAAQGAGDRRRPVGAGSRARSSSPRRRHHRRRARTLADAAQLDGEGGEVLADLTALGLMVRTGVASRNAIAGDESRASAFRRRELSCDTVVLCTGIRPNMELARDAGLAVGRGIKVTTDADHGPGIYAIGNAPSTAAGSTAWSRRASSRRASRRTTSSASAPRYGLGRRDQAQGRRHGGVQHGRRRQLEQDPSRLADLRPPGTGIYRRIVRRGQGRRRHRASATGPRSTACRKPDARGGGCPWHARRFSTGRLWGGACRQRGRVAATATVCNCTGVTRGSSARRSPPALVPSKRFRRRPAPRPSAAPAGRWLQRWPASRCKPAAPAFARSIIALSILALLIAGAILFLPSPGYRQSVLPASDRLAVADGLDKQISGFTLLGLGRWRLSCHCASACAGWRSAPTAPGASSMSRSVRLRSPRSSSIPACISAST